MYDQEADPLESDEGHDTQMPEDQVVAGGQGRKEQRGRVQIEPPFWKSLGAGFATNGCRLEVLYHSARPAPVHTGLCEGPRCRRDTCRETGYAKRLASQFISATQSVCRFLLRSGRVCSRGSA